MRSVPLLSICFFSSYTERFDKVKLEKLVDNVAELPDPEVIFLNMPLMARNSLSF